MERRDVEKKEKRSQTPKSIQTKLAQQTTVDVPSKSAAIKRSKITLTETPGGSRPPRSVPSDPRRSAARAETRKAPRRASASVVSRESSCLHGRRGGLAREN